MPTFTNPTDIARETLKLLSVRRLLPTPENYQKIYDETSGKPSGVGNQGADQALQKILQGLAKKNPALSKTLALIDKAIGERDWKEFESGMSALVGQSGGEEASWANLIRELLKQWDLKQSGLPIARKKEGVERVLINFASDSRNLHKKLQALVNAWAKNPAGQAGVQMDESTSVSEESVPVLEVQVSTPVVGVKALSVSADALSKDNFRLLREMLAKTLEIGIVPHLTQFPELAGEANKLAVMVRAAEGPDALEKLSKSLKQYWVKLELRGESDAVIMDGLLKLLKLLVDNISELSLDDQWLHGQIAVVQEIISQPLNPRVIYDVERSFKELIYKQGALKQGLNDAKTTLKHMVTSFIGRLGEMSSSTSEYNKRIEGYSEQISKTDDINQLNRILENLMSDTKGMQVDMQRSRDEMEETRKQVEASENKIKELEAELDKTTSLVQEDFLTGTLNRRGMEDAFQREFARSERTHTPLCVALFDIDYFKRLNDTYGHDAGDDALIHLVRVVKETLRPTDVIARFGGEEFVIILPETGVEEGTKTMMRLQRELTKKFFLHKNEKVLITFSAGIALRQPDESADAIISRADQALYKAKAAGRNRVFAAE
ncbi:diguanylate cyclase [Sulfuricella sp. T08]|uniref:GGDEF domain-containing protein n=1 Tax=Sulfuricella sp. T08 TaxID=1632857 RepID=UPI0006179BC2|nr:GGDEF domain-containing protein [Sulfuricella sp. T08]GAO36386.1 diguanylate cyclase [Sulfuricella sp. T08]